MLLVPPFIRFTTGSKPITELGRDQRQTHHLTRQSANLQESKSARETLLLLPTRSAMAVTAPLFMEGTPTRWDHIRSFGVYALHSVLACVLTRVRKTVVLSCLFRHKIPPRLVHACHYTHCRPAPHLAVWSNHGGHIPEMVPHNPHKLVHEPAVVAQNGRLRRQLGVPSAAPSHPSRPDLTPHVRQGQPTPFHAAPATR